MTELTDCLDRGWSELAAGLDDPGHSFHRAALATVGLGGAAEARIVVLRRVDRTAAMLDVHSDAAATKGAELGAHPMATLLFWSSKAALQLRARLEMSVVTGPARDAVWDALSDPARTHYGNTPPPGAPLATPDDHAPTVARERFAVLSGRIASLDIVDLGAAAPRRALYRREDGFAGTWLAP